MLFARPRSLTARRSCPGDALFVDRVLLRRFLPVSLPMTTLRAAFLLLLFLLLAGCDTFFTVALTSPADTGPVADSTLTLDHRCGETTVRLIVWQGMSFDFYQTFAPTDTLTLYADSLVVTYDGERYPARHSIDFDPDTGTLSDDHRTFTVEQAGEVRTAFEITEKRVDAGDTIRVETAGYAYCAGRPLSLGTWTGVPDDDIRGPWFFEWTGL